MSQWKYHTLHLTEGDMAELTPGSQFIMSTYVMTRGTVLPHEATAHSQVCLQESQENVPELTCSRMLMFSEGGTTPMIWYQMPCLKLSIFDPKLLRIFCCSLSLGSNWHNLPEKFWDSHTQKVHQDDLIGCFRNACPCCQPIFYSESVLLEGQQVQGHEVHDPTKVQRRTT